MTQLTIVTTPTNSGDGTPLATAFNYCNSNFSELYARVQTDPPTSLVGTIGDQAGMYAYDSTYFYYCFANYDGSSTIWGQLTQVGNIAVSAISSGTSNVKIVDLNGNATTSIDGTSNVVVIASTGQYITGLISATGNIDGNYILGNGSQLTGLPETYNNSNVIVLLASYGSNVISTAGNVTGGNLLTSNTISATGNITTSGYFVGDFIGNITGTITNIPGPGGAVLFNDGSGNVAATAGLIFDNSGPNILTVDGSYSAAGSITAVGNITGGNLIGTNIVGNITTATQNNITSVGTLTSLAVTANIIGGNITTAGQICVTGNISGNNLILVNDVGAGGIISASGYTGLTSSVTGNVIGGNIRTVGQVSATGNITAAYFFGNGSQLTALNTNTIQNGNSNVLIGSSAGNISVNVNGTSPITIFTPLGQNIYGALSVTGNVTAASVIGGVISGLSASVIGSVTSASVNSGAISGSSLSVTGNVTAANTIGGVISGSSVSVTGNVSSGNIITAGTLTVNSGNALTAIINGGGNTVGNIGSSSNYFNRLFATATTALYADLAEYYSADFDYAPGTVVVFGGNREITCSTLDADTAVAGVVSTNPAYTMNAGLDVEYPVAVALVGRVPCRVKGPVQKGSLMVATTDGCARPELAPAPGTIIGKALESFAGELGTIEIVVGRT